MDSAMLNVSHYQYSNYNDIPSSVSCSQDDATGPYPELDESSLH